MTNEEQWRVNYHRGLEKENRRLPKQHIKRVLETIEALATNPRPHGSRKIKGHDLWRVQVGVYRILYHVDDEKRVVNSYRIGHRKGVYRNL